MPLRLIGNFTVEDAALEAFEEYEATKILIASLGRFLEEIGPLLPDSAVFAPHCHYFFVHPEIRFARSDLPAMRKAIGRMHVTGKEVEDAKKRTVKVTLESEAWPGIKFQYSRPLPEPTDGVPACRIITEYQPWHQLVCDVR